MRIRLESSPSFFIPAWLVEASLAYRSRENRERLVEECVQIFCEGLRGPDAEAWHSLLAGEIPYTVQGGTVTFSFEE